MPTLEYLQHVHVVPQTVSLEPTTQFSGFPGSASQVKTPSSNGAFLQVHVQPLESTLHVFALAIF